MTVHPICDTDNNSNLSKSQKALLDYIENFGWGKIEVTVKNGQPVMVKEIEKVVKLD